MILNEFFNLPQVFEKDMNEFDASGYDRYSIYMDDYDLKEKFSDLDDAVEAIEAYKRDDPKSRYADYNVRDLNGKVVWRNDAWQDVPKPGKIQFLPRNDQGVAEGMFGSRPSPVLPIVDKIAKVAGELTPQNVEVGKQIIQANARDITRILSPGAKAGVDVIEQDELEEVDRRGFLKGVGAAAVAGAAGGANAFDFGKKNNEKKFEDFITEPADKEKYLGLHKKAKQLYTAMAINPSLRAAAYVEIAAFKTFKKQMAEKYKISDNLDEQGMAEAKDDYVPPKEADYGKKYQAMVLRVGEKARAQEKAKQQQQPKQPVRESRLALLKQIIQS